MPRPELIHNGRLIKGPDGPWPDDFIHNGTRYVREPNPAAFSYQWFNVPKTLVVDRKAIATEREAIERRLNALSDAHR